MGSSDTTPPVVQRYEWLRAGDVLHLDIKRSGRIKGIGHRIHGDHSRAQPGADWELVHVAIDGATRLAYVDVRWSQRARVCAVFLARAIRWFSAPRHPYPPPPDRQQQRLSLPPVCGDSRDLLRD